jgi:hypothetical protein
MDILLHWKCLEFKYYSTLTSVHRLSPTVTTDPLEREECLRSARLALECVKVIMSTSKSLGHFIEGYDPYLAWYAQCQTPHFAMANSSQDHALIPTLSILCGVLQCSRHVQRARLPTPTSCHGRHLHPCHGEQVREQAAPPLRYAFESLHATCEDNRTARSEQCQRCCSRFLSPDISATFHNVECAQHARFAQYGV